MQSTPGTPPLMQLLLRLRAADFPLGSDDFVSLERLIGWHLARGPVESDREDMLRLICLLWAKSPEDRALITREYEQFITGFTQLRAAPPGPAPAIVPPPLPPPPSTGTEVLAADQANRGTRAAYSLPVVLPPDAGHSRPSTDPVTAARSAQLRDNTLSANALRFRSDYFPITVRQMQQSWRHVRRAVREGPKIELDIDATVQQVGRDGMLRGPVMVPKRINRAEVLLLIDVEGSMVPFHLLTRQLGETALRGGGLYSTRIFYFHDIADQHVYHDRSRNRAMALLPLLANHDARCPILIISDAGAARGKHEDRRIAATRIWLQRLRATRANVAWLNPMPVERWRGSSAELIANSVPMFQMNREGLDSAIGVLRGRASPGGGAR